MLWIDGQRYAHQMDAQEGVNLVELVECALRIEIDCAFCVRIKPEMPASQRLNDLDIRRNGPSRLEIV